MNPLHQVAQKVCYTFQIDCHVLVNSNHISERKIRTMGIQEYKWKCSYWILCSSLIRTWARTSVSLYKFSSRLRVYLVSPYYGRFSTLICLAGLSSSSRLKWEMLYKWKAWRLQVFLYLNNDCLLLLFMQFLSQSTWWSHSIIYIVKSFIYKNKRLVLIKLSLFKQRQTIFTVGLQHLAEI